MLLTALLLIIIDYFYLSAFSSYFNKQVSLVQGSSITMDFNAAILCYLALILGLYHFIIKPRRSVMDAFILGFVIYTVFETTNKAILKNWSWTSVLIDSIWGGILFALTTALTYKLS